MFFFNDTATTEIYTLSLHDALPISVTLLASLWFDSLGHGGWWLLFALLGLIISLARLRGTTTPVAGTPEGGWRRREALIRAGRDVARYLLAGAILAWRLG